MNETGAAPWLPPVSGARVYLRPDAEDEVRVEWTGSSGIVARTLVRSGVRFMLRRRRQAAWDVSRQFALDLVRVMDSATHTAEAWAVVDECLRPGDARMQNLIRRLSTDSVTFVSTSSPRRRPPVKGWAARPGRPDHDNLTPTPTTLKE